MSHQGAAATTGLVAMAEVQWLEHIASRNHCGDASTSIWSNCEQARSTEDVPLPVCSLPIHLAERPKLDRLLIPHQSLFDEVNSSAL